jgi:membrane-bound ClpP family serine protease
MLKPTLVFVVIFFRSRTAAALVNHRYRKDDMREVPLTLLLGAITAAKIILALLVWLAWRARSKSAGARVSRMIGLIGRAVTDVAGEGRVMVMGEYWWARSKSKIAQGEMVKVVARDGLTLEVETCSEKMRIPKRVSALPRRRAITPQETPHKNIDRRWPSADRQEG